MKRLVWLMILGVACEQGVENGADTGFAPEAELAEAALYGGVNYGADCTTQDVVTIEKAMRYGRIAAASNAFEQCVDSAVRVGLPNGGYGPYQSCAGEPFATSAVDSQIRNAIAASRTPAAVQMDCTGGGGNASTNLGVYGTQDEWLDWGQWLHDIVPTLNQPVCVVPGQVGCRFAPEPWPSTQIAGTVWHEIMHRHGYSHGANDQVAAAPACGYANTPSWDFQRNTMPYIIGGCVDAVLTRSAQTCGNLDTCGVGEIRVLDTFTGNTCSCRPDPRMTGLGVLEGVPGKFAVEESVPVNDFMGAWPMSNSTTVLGAADVDNDGKQELIVRDGVALGVLGRDANGRLVSESSRSFNTQIGAWRIASTDRLLTTADLNGDRRDELIFGSTLSGIVVLSIGAGNVWSVLTTAPWGTNIGGYVLNSADVVRGAEVEGDVDDELILHGPAGRLGLLRLNGNALAAMTVWSPGAWVGGWNKGTDNTLTAIGDFDGDQRAELVLTSPWGLGMFEWNGAALAAVTVRGHGSTLTTLAFAGAWTLAATDAWPAVADMNGDGWDDLVVRSTTAFGVLSLDSTRQLRTRSRALQGSVTTGGWRLAVTDTIVGAANLDRWRGDELVVRTPFAFGALTFGWNDFTLLTFDMAINQTLLDHWQVGSTDSPFVVGDLDGDGADEVVVLKR